MQGWKWRDQRIQSHADQSRKPSKHTHSTMLQLNTTMKIWLRLTKLNGQDLASLWCTAMILNSGGRLFMTRRPRTPTSGLTQIARVHKCVSVHGSGPDSCWVTKNSRQWSTPFWSVGVATKEKRARKPSWEIDWAFGSFHNAKSCSIRAAMWDKRRYLCTQNLSKRCELRDLVTHTNTILGKAWLMYLSSNVFSTQPSAGWQPQIKHCACVSLKKRIAR